MALAWRGIEPTCLLEGQEHIGVFEDIDDSFFEGFSYTISYSPNEKEWISLHDYIPNFMFAVDKKLYSFYEDKVFEHERGDYGKFYDEIVYPAILDILQNTGQETHFKSIAFKDIVTKDASFVNETFTHITVRTNQHCSPRIALIPLTNTRKGIRTKGYWMFNGFRDVLKRDENSNYSNFLQNIQNDYKLITDSLDETLPDWKQRRFINSYIIVRLEYDNLANKEIQLIDVKTNFLPVP